MTIGFIGLGNMGAPMAYNLVAAGFKVFGYDISVPCSAELCKSESARHAAAEKTFVITMLPDGTALRNVAEDILPVMDTNSIYLDCSTVDIESVLEVSRRAKERGIEFIDAPVSGGVSGAESGSLTFMAGGTANAFERVKPLFEVMGKRAVHCGKAGSGQAAKICNNMILGATMIVTCEAFGLADKLSLDRQKMFDVVSTSSGYSWSMNVYCPCKDVGPQSPADNNYRPGFGADLMLKDLRLAQQAAEATGSDTPIGREAMKVYERFVEKESGSGLDFSAIIKKFTSKTS